MQIFILLNISNENKSNHKEKESAANHSKLYVEFGLKFYNQGEVTFHKVLT